MRSVVQSGLICLSLCFAVSITSAKEVASTPAKLDLPDSVREYLAAKYFDECEPGDARIEKAVEVLQVPDAILAHIRTDDWEAGQLENFATNKLHLIVKASNGETHSIVFRDGQKRSDRKLTPERERVLRRLYSDAAFGAPEAAELVDARRKLDPTKVLEQAIAGLDDKHALDEDTLKRARENLKAAKGGGTELAIALAALGAGEHPIANRWAAVWLVSRMDKMDFDREDSALSINDLETMDARTFYEDVFYATKARLEFAWGTKCGDADFLQQVLSPRGTGEPLQRWRRHFFEALEPELRSMKDGDAGKAIDLARSAAYDFFQYEGDTTWEDFGMLTALAVHEGRCEDCSNVENCMLRAAGLPAAQAFTPWWGAGDGNHAWTVIPSIDGGKNGNGGKAVKVYLKTWDKLEDITAVNTEVMDVAIELDEAATGEKAALCVWNHEEWRVVARSKIDGHKVTFKDVGRRRSFVLCVQADDSKDRLVALVDGKQINLDNPATPDAGKEAFECEFEKACDLGEFQPDEDYTVYVHTLEGWQEVDSARVSTGAVSFTCDPSRLYRVVGAGINARPFTAKLGVDGPVLTRF